MRAMNKHKPALFVHAQQILSAFRAKQTSGQEFGKPDFSATIVTSVLTDRIGIGIYRALVVTPSLQLCLRLETDA